MTKAKESRLELSVNGHTLRGVKRRGKWHFECLEWPDVAADHEGDTDIDGVLDDFMAQALAGAITVRKAFGSL